MAKTFPVVIATTLQCIAVVSTECVIAIFQSHNPGGHFNTADILFSMLL